MARDAWYHGPVSITHRDATYWRLPHREYLFKTGPSVENSDLLSIIQRNEQGGAFAKIVTNDDLVCVFPCFPDVAFDWCTLNMTRDSGFVKCYNPAFCKTGNAPFPKRDFFGDVFTLMGGEVPTARYAEIKEGVLREEVQHTQYLGDSSAEQPIPFIEESVFRKLYPAMPQMATIANGR